MLGVYRPRVSCQCFFRNFLTISRLKFCFLIGSLSLSRMHGLGKFLFYLDVLQVSDPTSAVGEYDRAPKDQDRNVCSLSLEGDPLAEVLLAPTTAQDRTHSPRIIPVTAKRYSHCSISSFSSTVPFGMRRDFLFAMSRTFPFRVTAPLKRTSPPISSESSPTILGATGIRF